MKRTPRLGHFCRPVSRRARRILGTMLLISASITLIACEAPASGLDGGRAEHPLAYQVDYLVTPQPARGGASVVLTVSQPRRLLREIDMQIGAIDTSSVIADGGYSLNGRRLVWNPPDNGGVLRWFVPIANFRSEDTYDAYIDYAWALFRAEDIIPRARSRTLKGATSITRIKFDLPDGWSSNTEYFGRNNDYSVANPTRRFDQPTGWILLGNLGVRIDDIAGTRVIVAAPVAHGARRLDILALLQWTLPELKRVLPDFPARLTVMSAAGPMWRGGLSAPASLFIHADLPLISENGTSTLLHEVLHIGLDLRAAEGADWIIEGLAEFYGLELLKRTNTISVTRHSAAIEKLRAWGSDAKNLCRKQSTGPVTAQATAIFHALDLELRSNNEKNVTYSLDDLLPILQANESKVTVEDLQNAARQLVGFLPTAIESKNLPGCTE